MTLEQVHWASAQFWFERSGKDSQGLYVVGRDCWGSRPALVFYEFDKLTVWASGQRDLSLEIASCRPREDLVKKAVGMSTLRRGRMLVLLLVALVVASVLWFVGGSMNGTMNKDALKAHGPAYFPGVFQKR